MTTILLDRPAVSRLAKGLRRTAGMPSHSTALEAVARAMGFRDANPMVAALVDGGVITLVVGKCDDVTEALIWDRSPTVEAAAEQLRRMLRAVGMLGRSRPRQDAEASRLLAGAAFRACRTWYPTFLALDGAAPVPLDILTVGMDAPVLPVHECPLLVPEMAARAGVRIVDMATALADELETGLSPLSLSEDSAPEEYVASQAYKVFKPFCPGLDWEDGAARFLSVIFEVWLMNEKPWNRKIVSCVARVEGKAEPVDIHAVRGFFGREFVFHAVRSGLSIERTSFD